MRAKPYEHCRKSVDGISSTKAITITNETAGHVSGALEQKVSDNQESEKIVKIRKLSQHPELGKMVPAFHFASPAEIALYTSFGNEKRQFMCAPRVGEVIYYHPGEDALLHFLKNDMMGFQHLMLRSAHKMEGLKGQSWSGVFDSRSIERPKFWIDTVPKYARIGEHESFEYSFDTSPITEVVGSIKSRDFKARRYAKRYGIQDFSMDDMGIIFMPYIPHHTHLMIRPENDRISILRNLWQEILVDPGSTSDSKYASQLQVYRDIENFFGSPQEVELCIGMDEKTYILQSRDFPEQKTSRIQPLQAELPDREFPVYIIDEHEKTPDSMIQDLHQLGMQYEDYMLVVNRFQECDFNDRYQDFFDEARVSFLPRGTGNMRPMHGGHNYWDTTRQRCMRIHDRTFNYANISKYIQQNNGCINPAV